MANDLVQQEKHGSMVTAEVYSRVADPLKFAEQMSKSAASLLKAPIEQGMAIAMHSLCEGITLVEMRRRYHWIQGGPSMRADAMLAEFRMNHGGDYEVHESSPTECRITFTDSKGRETAAEVTWEEMKDSRWPWVDWKDHEKGFKDSWATPRDRKTMMFNRLVTETLRQICPELVAGVYTPEELEDAGTVQTIDAQVVAPTVAEIVNQHEEKASLPAPVEAEPVEAEPVESVLSQPVASDPASPGSVADRQVERIRELFESIPIGQEKQAEILAKRNAQSVRNLSQNQAEELIDRLEAIRKPGE